MLSLFPLSRPDDPLRVSELGVLSGKEATVSCQYLFQNKSKSSGSEEKGRDERLYVYVGGGELAYKESEMREKQEVMKNNVRKVSAQRWFVMP